MNDGSKITGNTYSPSYPSSSPLGGGAVCIGGGTFTMIGGSIRGNTTVSHWTDPCGGGVYVYNSGTFIMEGGAISENTAFSETHPPLGGGVYVSDSSSFTMKGGTISGNTFSTTHWWSGGGGVCVAGATFIMSGGTISGNTASASSSSTSVTSTSYGGGVYVSHSGIFKKTQLAGGIIYGSDATGNDTNGNHLKNTASSGPAVYVSSSPANKKRNTTAGQTDQIDTTTGKGLSTSGNPPFGE
jgi:hypothetical protein